MPGNFKCSLTIQNLVLFLFDIEITTRVSHIQLQILKSHFCINTCTSY